MKILFYGDSITDMDRNRQVEDSLGIGYVRSVADYLVSEDPIKYKVINRGISGNRVVDLYARIKSDVWNIEPDVLSIYIGVNDIWHEIDYNNGVDVERFEKVYRMLIEDTLKRLPNVKFILVAPFVTLGTATEKYFDKFNEVSKYEDVVVKLAKEYNFAYITLQEDFDKAVEKYGSDIVVKDGVHPCLYGATIIAKKWVECFKKNIDK